MSAARPQAFDALERANAIRCAMAETMRPVRRLTPADGLLAAADLLDHPDPVVARMKLGYLLRAIPRVGHKRAERIAEAIGAPTRRRIGPARLLPAGEAGMSVRQRAALADELRRLAPRAQGADRFRPPETCPQCGGTPDEPGSDPDNGPKVPCCDPIHKQEGMSE